MILNEFEAVTNLAHVPIISTYYAQTKLSRSAIQYDKYNQVQKIVFFKRAIEIVRMS